MNTKKALDETLYAGNPHVRFDEGEVALAATPSRRGFGRLWLALLALPMMLPADARAALSAKSYISDGLIAHLDGIENVSYGGAHDNAATIWTELTGNGPNIAKPTGSAFVDEGLQTIRANGTQVAAANAKKILDAFAAAHYTVEVAFNQSGATPKSSQGHGYVAPFCQMLAFGHEEYWLGTREDKLIGMNPNKGGNAYSFAANNCATITSTIGQHSFSCSQRNTVRTTRVDGDDTKTKTATVTPIAAPERTRGFNFNRGGYYQDYGLAGVYHSVRIYGRELSAYEAAVNCAVDKVRYFGANAALTPLPDGWRFNTLDGVKLEKRLDLSVRNGLGGTVSVNGGAAAIDNVVWCEQGEKVAVTLVAAAADGYDFIGWAGIDGPERKNHTVTASIDSSIYAVFRRTGSSDSLFFTWDGVASDDWNNELSWTDSDGLRALPTAGDSVMIPFGKTAMMTNSSPRFASVTVEGALVMTNWTTCLNADAVTINKGGVLTCGAAATSKSNMSRVWIVCADLSIAQGGKIDVAGKSRLDVRTTATNATDLYGAYVTVGGTMTIGTNCFVYAWSDTETPSAPHFAVGSLNVATGGTFSAAWRGGRCGLRTGRDIACYREGGSRMSARGAGSGTAGAGHGGRGGLGADTSSAGGRTYDDQCRPWLPGSGAGAWDQSSVGGYGGGAILVSAPSGTIRIDGEVNVDGCNGNAFCNGLGGGGSGGTIFF